jgi:hypothetical protein
MCLSCIFSSGNHNDNKIDPLEFFLKQLQKINTWLAALAIGLWPIRQKNYIFSL